MAGNEANMVMFWSHKGQILSCVTPVHNQSTYTLLLESRVWHGKANFEMSLFIWSFVEAQIELFLFCLNVPS